MFILISVATFNVQLNAKSVNLSDLALANIEALANGETGEVKLAIAQKQTVTNYYYDVDGKLIKTVTYEEDCCGAASVWPCTYKQCGES